MLRRVAAFVGLLAAAFLVAGLVVPTTASAAGRCIAYEFKVVKGPRGSIHYVKVCVKWDAGGPGEPGGGGTPSCDLAAQKQAPPAGFSGWYCKGKAVCANRENIVPLAPPSTPAPEGQTWVREDCWPCGGCLGPPTSNLVLNGTVARPLIIQALEAFGNLDRPGGTVSHSPTDKAVVRLETWLWLAGAHVFERMTGSSAEGLVAVAVPDTTIWDTGDGHTQTCPGGGVDIDARGSGTPCTHTYDRSSPAYHGTVTRRWVVHYENGGATIDIPGAPLELTAVTNFDLAVVETQVVTGD